MINQHGGRDVVLPPPVITEKTKSDQSPDKDQPRKNQKSFLESILQKDSLSNLEEAPQEKFDFFELDDYEDDDEQELDILDDSELQDANEYF